MSLLGMVAKRQFLMSAGTPLPHGVSCGDTVEEEFQSLQGLQPTLMCGKLEVHYGSTFQYREPLRDIKWMFLHIRFAHSLEE